MGSAAWRPVSVLGNREALQAGCHHVSVSTQVIHPIPGAGRGEVWTGSLEPEM